MATFLRRSLVAAIVTVVSGTGLVALAAPASAQTVESGVVKFGGDPGDYITGGQEYAYDTGAGDGVRVSGSPGNSTVTVGIDGVNGDWWTLDFDAPNAQPLTAGTTYTATRYPFNGAGAGFDLSGNGRGCNELTATFTVTEAEFGDNGYVASFHASFEQHCEGGQAAASGVVHITNPPPPAALELTTSVTPEGTVSPVSGRARVNGQVTCNYPTTVSLSGDVSQVVRGRIVRGPLSGSLTCAPDAPATWTTIVTPSGDRPFVKGKAEVSVSARAHDETYDRDVTTSVTAVTTLSESSPALTDF
jgi:hypothetical protein